MMEKEVTLPRSCESSGSEPPASGVSDQHSMLEHAYEATQNAFHVTREGKLESEEVDAAVRSRTE